MSRRDPAKRVVLMTGTPCVGKTSLSRLLASRLDALYIDLTELATREKLVLGKDKKRGSMIVDERRMKQRIQKIVEGCSKEHVIVDGHYAVHVVPEEYVTHVFVLRRNPVELKRLMEQRGFSEPKLWENLASEILDVCLVDALGVYEEKRICELDVSGKTVEASVNEVLEVLNGGKKCYVGSVDWLGKLENEGLLDDYLRI